MFCLILNKIGFTNRDFITINDCVGSAKRVAKTDQSGDAVILPACSADTRLLISFFISF